MDFRNSDAVTDSLARLSGEEQKAEKTTAIVLSAAPAKGAVKRRGLPGDCMIELARLSLLLDSGEASAILLAEQAKCRFLLSDERRGREIARHRVLTRPGPQGACCGLSSTKR